MAVDFPFGDASVVELVDSATQTVVVNDTMTIVHAPAGGFSQALTAVRIGRAGSQGNDVKVGARIIFDLLQGAVGYDVTINSASDPTIAPVLTGVLNDRDTLELAWDGTTWVARTALWQKIVNAV